VKSKHVKNDCLFYNMGKDLVTNTIVMGNGVGKRGKFSYYLMQLFGF
jgi:hypothetical protein